MTNGLAFPFGSFRSPAMPGREPTRLCASQIFAPLEASTALIPELGMDVGAPTIFAGAGYTGKTLILQALVLALVTGRSAWGRFSAPQGRKIQGLHVDAEQGSRLTRERYQRLAVGLNVDPREIADGDLELILEPCLLDEPGAENAYDRLFDGKAIAILDCLRALTPSALENSSDIRRYVDLLARCSNRTGTAVALIHHARKPSRDDVGGDQAAMRGSSAIFDAAASVLMVQKPRDGRTRVRQTKNRTTGQIAEAFDLQIEDVHSDGAMAGLRVTAGPPARSLSSLRQDVLAAIERLCPATKNGVAKEVRHARQAVLLCIDELASEGLVALNAEKKYEPITTKEIPDESTT